MTNDFNPAKKVRDEDQLDRQKLHEYLSSHLSGFNSDSQLTLKQYAGGASNMTYLLQWQENNTAVKNNQYEAILRTAPLGANIKSAHDMGREYKVLRLLQNHFKYSPKALLMCEDETIIGRPFYIMQKVEGIIPRKSFPMPVSAQLATKMCHELLDVHIALHTIDIEKTGLISLGQPHGYIQRQISGWNLRYEKAKLEDSLPAQELMQWLDEQQPKDTLSSFIHNDYKFDNVVFSAQNPEKICAVLDWEMATVGSPLMDLGCSMAYWIEKTDPPAMQAIRMMPTQLDGMLTRQQIVRYYAEKRHIDISEFNYFYVFGLFRLAVIVQQIYKRYALGKTSNLAFKNFGDIAKVLIVQAEHQRKKGII